MLNPKGCRTRNIGWRDLLLDGSGCGNLPWAANSVNACLRNLFGEPKSGSVVQDWLDHVVCSWIGLVSHEELQYVVGVALDVDRVVVAGEGVTGGHLLPGRHGCGCEFGQFIKSLDACIKLLNRRVDTSTAGRDIVKQLADLLIVQMAARARLLQCRRNAVRHLLERHLLVFRHLETNSTSLRGRSPLARQSAAEDWPPTPWLSPRRPSAVRSLLGPNQPRPFRSAQASGPEV